MMDDKKSAVAAMADGITSTDDLPLHVLDILFDIYHVDKHINYVCVCVNKTRVCYIPYILKNL